MPVFCITTPASRASPAPSLTSHRGHLTPIAVSLQGELKAFPSPNQEGQNYCPPGLEGDLVVVNLLKPDAGAEQGSLESLKKTQARTEARQAAQPPLGAVDKPLPTAKGQRWGAGSGART